MSRLEYLTQKNVVWIISAWHYTYARNKKSGHATVARWAQAGRVSTLSRRVRGDFCKAMVGGPITGNAESLASRLG